MAIYKSPLTGEARKVDNESLEAARRDHSASVHAFFFRDISLSSFLGEFKRFYLLISSFFSREKLLTAYSTVDKTTFVVRFKTAEKERRIKCKLLS